MADVPLQIPSHVGFVVDGNRRWAKAHGLPWYEGHLAGHNTLKQIVPACFDAGLTYVSLYVFSTENWNRSSDEVSRLMALIFKILTDDLKMFMENNVRLRVLGSRDRVSDKILRAIDEAEEATKGNTRGTVCVCFNYGGHLEIADAFKKIVQSGVSPDDITPELIAGHMYAADVPPCDLIVRTSGEQRLSNFMLWRAAYSELMFLDKNWPDMTKDDITAIIEEYTRRNRRFGK